MKRRDFLKVSIPALAAVSLAGAGCGGGFTPPAEDNHNPPFPELNFITRDPAFSDYRPAVDATGEIALFERTPAAGGDTKLFLARPISSANPTVGLFLTPPNRAEVADPIPASQTRPDWNWATGRVALNGAASNADPVHVVLAEADGGNPTAITGTQGYLYPIWTADGTRLVVYNDSEAAGPRPCTSLMLPDGTLLEANMNGLDANGTPVFAGFAAPSPQDPLTVAFAGQPTLPDWVPAVTPACPNDPSGYNQCYNYPFLNSLRDGVFTSAPLEGAASVSVYDPAYQGRAPYFSPDGRYLVFESDRRGGYALFLADLLLGTPPVQVTATRFHAQHAKFFPTGDRLIFTCLQEPGSAVRGIAWIDISGFLA